MKKKGKELIFISRIKRDGSGVIDVQSDNMKHLNNTTFNLNCLSITEETFIASEFNSFIVKLKQKKP